MLLQQAYEGHSQLSTAAEADLAKTKDDLEYAHQEAGGAFCCDRICTVAFSHARTHIHMELCLHGRTLGARAYDSLLFY